VFIPKYRRKTLYGKVKQDIREILRTLCSYKKVEIIQGAVCKDHVHMYVSIPPKLSVSDFMGYLKGKSALMVFDRHPEMGSKFNRHFWAKGYYVATVGNVTEDTVREYIEKQQEEDRLEDRALR
jgi:putative transposase